MRIKIISHYGFMSDPSLSFNHNLCLALGQYPLRLFVNKVANLSFHNLTGDELPSSVRGILGLGLNYIPTPKYSMDPSGTFQLDRFRRDVHLHSFFSGYPQNDDYDISTSRLHIRSEWAPDKDAISPELRARISHFIRTISLEFPSQKIRSNLLPIQVAGLDFLKVNPQYFVWPSDKNLGPVLTTRDTYRLKAYEHLNDTSTYRELNESSALSRLKSIEIIIRNFVNTYLSEVKTSNYNGRIHNATIPSKAGKFILHAFDKRKNKTSHTFSQFYIIAKVHKNPWSSRPITSYSGSALYNLGVWLDHQLQQIVSTLDYVAKSSTSVATDLHTLENLPPGTQLFTMDAVSMYTNIDTQHALAEIASFLESPDFNNRHSIDTTAVITALRIIMIHSVFHFDGKYFLQLTGTAMGAPPAPMYATLYYFIHERRIIPRYTSRLLRYTRYIDDALGIWIPHPDTDENDRQWHNFQTDIDCFGQLRWTCSTFAESVIFLDMTISIRNHRIHTTIYEKSLNLFLYIPPLSAHTPGLLSSLVRGFFFRLHRLCSDSTDRQSYISLLYTRLRRRGYDPHALRKVFLQSASVFDNIQTVRPSTTDRSLFLHATFHPPDRRLRLRRLFQTTIETPPGEPHVTTLTDMRNRRVFDPFRFVICYHRLPNLKNILCPRRVLSLTPPPRQADPPTEIQE